MATRISQRSSTPRSFSSRGAGYAPRRHHDRSSKSKSGSFFLGNIDKEMTREEVYEHLRNNCNIYITKFDMPKVNTGEKDANGRIVNCAGYAFVHTKTVQQAQEMMKRRTIKIGKLNAEIKPYDQAKREASQTRYREKIRSSNSTSSQAINQTNSPSDVEDWTITNENTHWDPTQACAQVKLMNLEPDSFVNPESAYCTDNDETMSLSQSIINSEAGRSVRGKPAALKMEMEQTEYVNMALKAFKDNDETPTVEKINAKISEWTGRNQTMVQEENPIEEETPVASFAQLNLENQQMNLLQAKTQVEDHQQQLLDNIMIAQHYQTVALSQSQQHLAPASLTYVQPVQTLTQAPFEHNPNYQMLLTQAMLRREQNSTNDNTYKQCYNMWYDYYMNNPAETARLYTTTTGSKWTEIVSDNVPKYLAL